MGKALRTHRPFYRRLIAGFTALQSVRGFIHRGRAGSVQPAYSMSSKFCSASAIRSSFRFSMSCQAMHASVSSFRTTRISPPFSYTCTRSSGLPLNFSTYTFLIMFPICVCRFILYSRMVRLPQRRRRCLLNANFCRVEPIFLKGSVQVE